MKIKFKLALAVLIIGASCLKAKAQPPIMIRREVNQLIPISFSGFSPEVESILKFDLSVLGIEESSQAEYTLVGTGGGRVSGTLAEGGQAVFSRAYSGGSTRAQAHALANDVAKAIRDTAPIFQTKIAFLIAHGPTREVCVSDFDGFNPIVLTHDGVLAATPSWLPGGHALLYASWMKGNAAIYEHNLSTGSRRAFADYPGSSFCAVVSPDGQKVAMILSKNGSPNLYVRNVDGSGLHQLTQSREEDSSPCWSPDSRTICYSCREGRATLKKISTEGGEASPMRVSGAYGNLTEPDWSPDGSQITFVSGSRPFHIWVAPAAGGEAKLVAEGEGPCWAPNSRTIIFTQQRPQKRVLCLLDVPTKHVKDVRQITGSCSEPSWAR